MHAAIISHEPSSSVNSRGAIVIVGRPPPDKISGHRTPSVTAAGRTSRSAAVSSGENSAAYHSVMLILVHHAAVCIMSGPFSTVARCSCCSGTFMRAGRIGWDLSGARSQMWYGGRHVIQVHFSRMRLCRLTCPKCSD
jgi:hypothetical protein